jgi:hypothetical protein
MDDAYTVQVTAAESQDADGLEQLMALKDADTFAVADVWGDMKGGADGLFDSDTRLLSRFVMTAGLARPSRLSSGISQDNVFFTAHSTNRPLPPMGGRSAPAGVLHIERRRFIFDRRLFERVRILNHGIEDGETGFLVETLEQAVAAAGRAHLLDREAIRARFDLRFSATAMARRYLDVYGDLLARRPFAVDVLDERPMPRVVNEDRSFAALA